MKIREITTADIPALFAVRTATDENCLSLDQLTALGITGDSVAAKLRDSYAGWLCEDGADVVGFAMGDRNTGELWVIAVLPAYVGRGIGSDLLRRVEDWLWSAGCTDLRLTTDIDIRLRAYLFYRHRGWVDSEVRDGNRYMTKVKGAH